MTLTEQANLLGGAFGVQSLRGKVLLRGFRKDLQTHFRNFSGLVLDLNLEKLVEKYEPREELRGSIEDEADRLVSGVVDAFEPNLFSILILWISRGYADATVIADKRLDELFKEADFGDVTTGDPTASEYAARRGAELIKDMGRTSRRTVRTTIAEGIFERLGVPGTARLLRARLRSMTKARSKNIALTEMNDAMSESTLQRLRTRSIQFKTTILSDRPCPICIGNEAQGPVPIDQPFKSGHIRTPFHPGCLCALIATRGRR